MIARRRHDPTTDRRPALTTNAEAIARWAKRTGRAVIIYDFFGTTPHVSVLDEMRDAHSIGRGSPDRLGGGGPKTSIVGRPESRALQGLGIEYMTEWRQLVRGQVAQARPILGCCWTVVFSSPNAETKRNGGTSSPDGACWGG